MRILFLDVLRGVAVLAMICYHFFWDLGFFGYVDFSLATTGFGLNIAQIIGSTFIFVSGFSLNLSSLSTNFQRNFWWRFAKLLSLSCLISSVTLIFDKNNFIFFGILHLLTFCSLIGFILIRSKNTYFIFLILVTTILISITNYKFDLPVQMSWLGLNIIVPNTSDFYPVIPWIIYFLMGLWLGKLLNIELLNSSNWGFNEKDILSHGSIFKFLSLSGRNSLVIYILHQPIFFSLFLIFNRIMS
tara:strand:- start:72 stop:803 length:732 start_codon:yes stop_codon:yes gene_type:complete